MSEADESLEAFAEGWTEKPRRPCSICLLPERAEIDEARKNDIRPAAIRAWLVAKKGYSEGEVGRMVGPMDAHWRRGHHVRSR